MSALGRFAASLAVGTLLVAAAGFGWFIRDARLPSAWPARADGIVALTGGSLRVEAAVALLRAGVSGRLLISGVGPGATLPAVLQNDEATAGAGQVISVGNDALVQAAITLGHGAQTTAGNAVETTLWVRANGMHSLVVVTAGYHMRRALAEIRAGLPDVRVAPYAVHPPAGLHTLLAEYAKLIAAELGVHPLTPSPGAA